MRFNIYYQKKTDDTYTNFFFYFQYIVKLATFNFPIFTITNIYETYNFSMKAKQTIEPT